MPLKIEKQDDDAAKASIDLERETKKGPAINETKAVKDAKTLLWQAEKNARETTRTTEKQKEEK